MKKRLMTLLAVCGFAVCAVAQQGPTPPAELEKLAYMLGDWEGTFSWTMPGMEGDMKMQLKCEMDGMFLRQTSKMDMQGAVATESAFFGWNAAESRWDVWTFTNFAPTPRIEHGTLEGSVLTVTSEPWAVEGMGEVVSRSTISKASDSEVSFKLEFKQGDQWMEVAHGLLKKKA